MFLYGVSAACSPEGGYGEGDPVVAGALGQVCPGTAASLWFMGVHSSQALRSRAAGGTGWPGAPSGRPQSPEGPALGSPRAQGLLAAPSKALHMELFSPHRPSVPVTALFLQAGGGRRLSCLREGGLLCLPRPPGAVLGPWQLALGGLLLRGILFSGLVTVQADTLPPWDQGKLRLISDKHV